MKLTILKSTLLAFIMVGTISCKNSEKETSKEIEAAAEASETALEYKVDSDISTIKWEGSKPTATHHGTISLSSGALLVNNGKIEAGKFVIDMNSITDEDMEGEYKTKLENHLKGTVEGQEGDFFNVKEFPEAIFELISFEDNKVKGNLTIKGKTNAIEFVAKQAINGDTLEFASEPIALDRTKWGVNFGSKSIFPSIGDKVISDTITITFSLIAKKV